MTIYSASLTLFLVMDPLGNVPVFLSVLNSVEPKRRHRIILRETFIAFSILVLFLFFGQYILKGLNITEPALGIAGGIILFLIAIKMIFPKHEGQQDEVVGEPFIVPLAIPLIAGPSAMAMVVLLSTHQPNKLLGWFAALAIASIASTIILLFSTPLRSVLGKKGLYAMERLMGMVLTTIAVQMFLDGINQYFHLLK